MQRMIQGITTCLLLSVVATAFSADAPAGKTPAAKPADQTSAPGEASREKPAAKKELSPAMTALRDRLRRTLASHRQQPFNTRDNTAADLMHFCLAFGCETEVSQVSGQKLNGITCLCWNIPCAGQELLMSCDGQVAARVGYGHQERPSQFLAVLALSHVPKDYPVRAADADVRKVADLVEFEKLTCRSATDLSLKLVALGFYAGDATWKNNLDEEWSVARIIREELARPTAGSPNGGTDRLLGLAVALEARANRKQPPDGEYLRAKKYLTEYHAYALELRNGDGSWGPQYFAARSTTRDTTAQLEATGRVMEWLAVSLPRERLDDPQVIASLEYLDSLLNTQRYRWNVSSLSSRDIAAVMHALHALAVYDQRVFEPLDEQKPSVPPVGVKSENKPVAGKSEKAPSPPGAAPTG